MAKLLIPMGKNVLVNPIPASDKLGEGIIVKAEAFKQPSGQATVVSIGADVTGLEAGDVVVFNWINGQDVNVEGRPLKLLDAAQILGKFKTV
jgi:co-chaperonin GroES (HSP10)